jgi:hypothetical protein
MDEQLSHKLVQEANMTANQIAYGNLQVNKAAVEEDKRHNQVEEDLAAKQLELDKLKIDNENWYKQEMARLQGISVETEQDRLNVEAAKAAEQERYQTTLNEISWQQTAIDSAALTENRRANQANEEIKRTGNFIADQRLKFDKYQFDTDFSWNSLLGRKKYQLEAERVRNEYELGTESNRLRAEALNLDRLSYGLKLDTLNLDTEKWQWAKETWSKEYELKKAALTKDAVFGAMPYILPNASSIVSGALKLLSN